MSSKRGTYDAIVSAASAEEAIEIAAEAVPKGAEVTKADATDVSDAYGKDSWSVVIKFRRGEPEGDY